MSEDSEPEALDIDVEEESEAERQDEKEGDNCAAGTFFHRLEYV
jgi:hypothetical protein